MRNSLLLLMVGGLIVLVIVGGAGWYLASPLFISQEVDEELPFAFEVPAEEELAKMSEEDLQDVRQQLEEAIPSQEEMASLPEERRQAIEDAAMRAVQALPEEPMEEPMPTELPAQPVLARQGEFQGADELHQGTGTARIFLLPDDSILLRLEAFEVTNGPDLRVLLASNPAPTDHASLGEYIELGSLKGNVGNQNYDIPADIDLAQYQSVVIYCVPFQVIVATAPLSQGAS